MVGEPLTLERLSFPALNETRQELCEALVGLCTSAPEQARAVLGLTVGQQEELARNQHLLQAPTAPAWQVYSGVLYSQLDAATLTPEQQRRLTESVWIASALFGFVGWEDPIPAYRLSGDTRLPGIGGLTQLWRRPLSTLLEQESELILDLRSGSYAQLGPVPQSCLERTVTVRVLQKQRNGPPRLVTHFNKATKGRIVRALASQCPFPINKSQLEECIASIGAEVIRIAPHQRQEPTLLEVLLPI